MTQRRLLIDENLPPFYRTQLLHRDQDLVVWRVGDAGAPPLGTVDPEILCWYEENEFLLVTSNRHSMPPHLIDHLARGHHVPGILVLLPNVPIGQALEELLLIAFASTEEDFRDQIVHFPF